MHPCSEDGNSILTQLRSCNALKCCFPNESDDYFEDLPNSSLASSNFSRTTSHASMRSLRPFSSTSYTLTSSIAVVSLFYPTPTTCPLYLVPTVALQQGTGLTVRLNPQVHLRVCWMRYRVSTKLDIRAVTSPTLALRLDTQTRNCSLLHNDVPQRITQCMVLIRELERCGCLAIAWQLNPSIASALSSPIFFHKQPLRISYHSYSLEVLVAVLDLVQVLRIRSLL